MLESVCLGPVVKSVVGQKLQGRPGGKSCDVRWIAKSGSKFKRAHGLATGWRDLTVSAWYGALDSAWMTVAGLLPNRSLFAVLRFQSDPCLTSTARGFRSQPIRRQAGCVGRDFAVADVLAIEGVEA